MQLILSYRFQGETLSGHSFKLAPNNTLVHLQALSRETSFGSQMVISTETQLMET